MNKIYKSFTFWMWSVSSWAFYHSGIWLEPMQEDMYFQQFRFFIRKERKMELFSFLEVLGLTFLCQSQTAVRDRSILNGKLMTDIPLVIKSFYVRGILASSLLFLPPAKGRGTHQSTCMCREKALASTRGILHMRWERLINQSQRIWMRDEVSNQLGNGSLC